jgi:hypothetical protein
MDPGDRLKGFEPDIEALIVQDPRCDETDVG